MFFLLSVTIGVRPAASAERPNVLLVTLDTTRADALSPWGGDASTPALAALAARGTRYASAWSAAPLTLPSHATLMTGLDPGSHGVRDNGLSPLPAGPPTLAERFHEAGYATAAFVGSAILDHRFGLARGFDHYADRLTAERFGEFGYPERSAGEVVDEALAWLASAGQRRPVLVWIHVYDAHAPYTPRDLSPSTPTRRRYEREIELVDREVGRLLAALPRPEQWLTAIVGDHGEAFGEAGEHEHGLLLGRATLEVPLLLAGPGVPAARAVPSPVAIRRLPATLLSLAGLAPAGIPGPPLPFVAESPAPPIVHESFYPASVYGWSPLVAVTSGRLRFVLGPSPRLHDRVADPGETQNLLADPVAGTRALRDLAREYLAAHPFPAQVAAPAPELARQLGALGYLSGASGRVGTIDPYAGVLWLADFERLRDLEAAGRIGPAVELARDLVGKSPDSVPFLARAAGLEQRAGELARAEALLRRSLELQPSSEFLHRDLGALLVASGRLGEGERELRRALEIDPRSATAWLALAELAARTEGVAGETAVLVAAVEAGTASGTIHARLAERRLAGGELDAAERAATRATELLPTWGIAWSLRGRVAERRGDRAGALDAYRRAAALGVTEATAALERLGTSSPTP